MRHARLIKTELDSMPAELDELSRKIMQLEIEEAASKEGNRPLKSQERLADTPEGACRACVKSLQAMKAQWQNEKRRS